MKTLLIVIALLCSVNSFAICGNSPSDSGINNLVLDGCLSENESDRQIIMDRQVLGGENGEEIQSNSLNLKFSAVNKELGINGTEIILNNIDYNSEVISVPLNSNFINLEVALIDVSKNQKGWQDSDLNILGSLISLGSNQHKEIVASDFNNNFNYLKNLVIKSKTFAECSLNNANIFGYDLTNVVAVSGSNGECVLECNSGYSFNQTNKTCEEIQLFNISKNITVKKDEKNNISVEGDSLDLSMIPQSANIQFKSGEFSGTCNFDNSSNILSTSGSQNVRFNDYSGEAWYDPNNFDEWCDISAISPTTNMGFIINGGFSRKPNHILTYSVSDNGVKIGDITFNINYELDIKVIKNIGASAAIYGDPRISLNYPNFTKVEAYYYNNGVWELGIPTDTPYSFNTCNSFNSENDYFDRVQKNNNMRISLYDRTGTSYPMPCWIDSNIEIIFDYKMLGLTNPKIKYVFKDGADQTLTEYIFNISFIDGDKNFTIPTVSHQLKYIGQSSTDPNVTHISDEVNNKLDLSQLVLGDQVLYFHYGRYNTTNTCSISQSDLDSMAIKELTVNYIEERTFEGHYQPTCSIDWNNNIINLNANVSVYGPDWQDGSYNFPPTNAQSKSLFIFTNEVDYYYTGAVLNVDFFLDNNDETLDGAISEKIKLSGLSEINIEKTLDLNSGSGVVGNSVEYDITDLKLRDDEVIYLYTGQWNAGLYNGSRNYCGNQNWDVRLTKSDITENGRQILRFNTTYITKGEIHWEPGMIYDSNNKTITISDQYHDPNWDVSNEPILYWGISEKQQSINCSPRPQGRINVNYIDGVNNDLTFSNIEIADSFGNQTNGQQYDISSITNRMASDDFLYIYGDSWRYFNGGGQCFVPQAKFSKTELETNFSNLLTVKTFNNSTLFPNSSRVWWGTWLSRENDYLLLGEYFHGTDLDGNSWNGQITKNALYIIAKDDTTGGLNNCLNETPNNLFLAYEEKIAPNVLLNHAHIDVNHRISTEEASSLRTGSSEEIGARWDLSSFNLDGQTLYLAKNTQNILDGNTCTLNQNDINSLSEPKTLNVVYTAGESFSCSFDLATKTVYITDNTTNNINNTTSHPAIFQQVDLFTSDNIIERKGSLNIWLLSKYELTQIPVPVNEQDTDNQKNFNILFEVSDGNSVYILRSSWQYDGDIVGGSNLSDRCTDTNTYLTDAVAEIPKSQILSNGNQITIKTYDASVNSLSWLQSDWEPQITNGITTNAVVEIYENFFNIENNTPLWDNNLKKQLAFFVAPSGGISNLPSLTPCNGNNRGYFILDYQEVIVNTNRSCTLADVGFTSEDNGWLNPNATVVNEDTSTCSMTCDPGFFKEGSFGNYYCSSILNNMDINSANIISIGQPLFNQEDPEGSFLTTSNNYAIKVSNPPATSNGDQQIWYGVMKNLASEEYYLLGYQSLWGQLNEFGSAYTIDLKNEFQTACGLVGGIWKEENFKDLFKNHEGNYSSVYFCEAGIVQEQIVAFDGSSTLGGYNVKTFSVEANFSSSYLSQSNNLVALGENGKIYDNQGNSLMLTSDLFPELIGEFREDCSVSGGYIQINAIAMNDGVLASICAENDEMINLSEPNYRIIGYTYSPGSYDYKNNLMTNTLSASFINFTTEGFLDTANSITVSDTTFKNLKDYGMKITALVGGYGQSDWFDTATSNTQNRTNFVNILHNYIINPNGNGQYKYDGVELDWEPTGGFTQIQLQNYKLFIEELKALLTSSGEAYTISVAFPANINQIVAVDKLSVSEFESLVNNLDYVTFMTYDMIKWAEGGAYSSYHTALEVPSGLGNGQHSYGVKSLEQDIVSLGLNIDRSKINIGLATYAKRFSSLQNSLDSSFSNYIPQGEILYKEIVSKMDISNIFNDSIFGSSYLYRPQNQEILVFDTCKDIREKSNWVKTNGYGGFAIWRIDGDLDRYGRHSLVDCLQIKNRVFTPPPTPPEPDPDSITISAYVNGSWYVPYDEMYFNVRINQSPIVYNGNFYESNSDVFEIFKNGDCSGTPSDYENSSTSSSGYWSLLLETPNFNGSSIYSFQAVNNTTLERSNCVSVSIHQQSQPDTPLYEAGN